MKSKFFFIVISTFCFSSCSSDEFEIKESEVPRNVVDALKAKYPTAQVLEWEAEKEDGKFFFEAEIKVGDKEIEVHITPDGSSITEEK
jgi:hypothetical protein